MKLYDRNPTHALALVSGQTLEDPSRYVPLPEAAELELTWAPSQILSQMHYVARIRRSGAANNGLVLGPVEAMLDGWIAAKAQP